ncbi:DUF982 domain-containing protein [Mesorhizobium escarrei]|nr:DUF982 domain-containing protein [Mesorhizobium escarrei]
MAAAMAVRFTPLVAVLAAGYGAYKLLQQYSAEAAVAIDSATAALAAQAAPLSEVKSGIGELVSLQGEHMAGSSGRAVWSWFPLKIAGGRAMLRSARAIPSVRRGVLRSGEPKRSRLFGRAISVSILSDSGALNSQRCNHCLVFAFSRLQSWRATKMPTSIPITIYLNHKPIVVASIPEAAKALQQPWPFMDKPSRLEAIRMIEECLAGHCTQQAAFAALKAAASEQGFSSRSRQA